MTDWTHLADAFALGFLFGAFLVRMWMLRVLRRIHRQVIELRSLM